MIPYFPQPVLRLGPIGIHSFAILAAVAVLVSCWMIVRRGQRQGIPAEEMFRFWFWMYASAILGSHLHKTVLENFPAFLDDPSSILQLNLGLSAVGAVIGGFAGSLLWCRYRRLTFLETLRRLEIVAYAIPFAWMFGRLGCALAHDHRGLPSTSWFAVNFPEGPRYDLGLLEFPFLMALAITFRLLDRRPRPTGFYFGMFGVLCGFSRIWLDSLRMPPVPSYGGVAAVIFGVLAWVLIPRFQRRGSWESTNSPAEPSRLPVV